MKDSQFEDLKQFLLSYVLARYHAEAFTQVWHYFEKMLKMDLMEFFTQMIKAFVKCILSTKNYMYLKDIVAVSIAETNYILNSPSKIVLITSDPRHSTYFPLDLGPFMETEIRYWLIYLQENSKLPGEYNRFIGQYTIR